MGQHVVALAIRWPHCPPWRSVLRHWRQWAQSSVQWPVDTYTSTHPPTLVLFSEPAAGDVVMTHQDEPGQEPGRTRTRARARTRTRYPRTGSIPLTAGMNDVWSRRWRMHSPCLEAMPTGAQLEKSVLWLVGQAKLRFASYEQSNRAILARRMEITTFCLQSPLPLPRLPSKHHFTPSLCNTAATALLPLLSAAPAWETADFFLFPFSSCHVSFSPALLSQVVRRFFSVCFNSRRKSET